MTDQEIQTVGQVPSLPVVAIVLTASLIAAVTDLRKFRVLNVVTLPVLLTGLVYHTATGAISDAGWAAGFLNSLLGALFGFGILFAFYVMGGMGAGDVKLMAGLGAWLGMPLTLYVFIASALATGLYAVVIVLAYSSTRETWINLKIIGHRLAAIGRHLGAEDRVEAEVNRADRRRRVIPFAAMVAVGVIAVLIWTWLGGQP
jgi:prepilin peptidase CpaA